MNCEVIANFLKVAKLKFGFAAFRSFVRTPLVYLLQSCFVLIKNFNKIKPNFIVIFWLSICRNLNFNFQVRMEF